MKIGHELLQACNNTISISWKPNCKSKIHWYNLISETVQYNFKNTPFMYKIKTQVYYNNFRHKFISKIEFYIIYVCNTVT